MIKFKTYTDTDKIIQKRKNNIGCQCCRNLIKLFEKKYFAENI